MIKRVFLFLLLCSVWGVSARVLIWDFGGVIFNPDKWGVARTIGLKHFLAYAMLDFQNPNIQQSLFEFLETVERATIPYKRAGTAEGMALPHIMNCWQAGTIDGPEVIQLCHKRIKELSAKGYFRSEREEVLFRKTIEAMFDPETLARNVHPVKEAVELLRECAEAKNPDGTKKNINIGFSNWDAKSYDTFYQLNRDSFKYFDHIMISGHIKMIKPHKEAYVHLLETYKLDPRDCTMIDDQDINDSRVAGIKSIQLKNGDYKKLRRRMRMLGYLDYRAAT